MIYFIACPQANAVKIGITDNHPTSIFKRLSVMQSSCPLELELLAVDPSGHRAEELELHTRFAPHRIRGEWFRTTEELRSHIARFSRPEKPLDLRVLRKLERAAA
jgi:hypothetical protein